MERVHEAARVLVVEDEGDILSLILGHLRQNGFAPKGFTDPLDALEEFRSDPEGYSVVLTDISMPRLTGIALAQALLQINPRIKIALMTAHEVVDEDRDLEVAKTEEIIRKPFKLSEICTRVKKYVAAP